MLKRMASERFRSVCLLEGPMNFEGQTTGDVETFSLVSDRETQQQILFPCVRLVVSFIPLAFPKTRISSIKRVKIVKIATDFVEDRHNSHWYSKGRFARPPLYFLGTGYFVSIDTSGEPQLHPAVNGITSRLRCRLAKIEFLLAFCKLLCWLNIATFVAELTILLLTGSPLLLNLGLF